MANSKRMWTNLARMLAVAASVHGGMAFAGVTAEEAKQLGTTLTPFGAEKAGNKDGTIPEYTGGLTKAPPGFVPGSGVRLDPFADEKPLYSISASNADKYADKLSDGIKALLKRFPTFRLDVYPTHRTVAYPELVLKNSVKNATRAHTSSGGLAMNGARAGVAFPIPKDGYEVMWNHITRYQGRASVEKMSATLVDSGGRKMVTGGLLDEEEFPFYDENPRKSDETKYYKMISSYWGPPRNAGNVFLVLDDIDMLTKGRVAYQYLPGQRRVKLAPEVAFDGPDSSTAGNTIYDEAWLFNGSMERYDMKLLGKKEMYVPYNAYRSVYHVTRDQAFGPKHGNPDVYRWELHRVWVVEGTLKKGKRHAYPRRVWYVDEDSWSALLGENYDAQGALVKVLYTAQTPHYDIPAGFSSNIFSYHLTSGNYLSQGWLGDGGYHREVPVKPEAAFTPGAIAGAGVR